MTVRALTKTFTLGALALTTVVLPSTAHAQLPADESGAACAPGADLEDVAAARGGHAADHRAISAAEQRRIERQMDRRLAGRNRFRVAGGVEVTIPVYFHVIKSTRGEGGVTAAQIDAQVAELNQDYAGGESGAAASTGFRFSLAGTDTYVNNNWFRGSSANDMRSETHLGGAKALNVWTLDFRYLGIASFPWDYASSPSLDGIRVLYTSLPGGTSTNYDQGKTATHEAGHWLGLYHTFQGGCVAPGDLVDDTPFQDSPSSGCPVGRDSCSSPGLDPIENYMDYSHDSCYNRFTSGQSGRMANAWSAYRA